MASRIQIQGIEPLVDCGRFAAKACVGDEVRVSATVFRDGHEVLGTALRVKAPGAARWRDEPMADLGNDRFAGSFTPDASGRWSYRVEAWVDPVASFQWELRRKLEGGQKDLSSELAEGALLLGHDGLTVEEALAAEPKQKLERTQSQALYLEVDRELARFGAWYELFPRSWGGFGGVERLLPRFAELGFDVLYLPPVHPIGTTNRKGRNNALTAGPDDPGSPWAIGGAEGGHTAINPELGTEAEFESLVARAREHGLEIALDYAIQTSPDHPWLVEHPEWFHRRPDGTLKYAENPPKRYQDIYNVNFDSEDREGLWNALRDAMLHWVERGVRVFRVDNPHTKPVPFWEWLIAEVRAREPELVLLSEAFTRPAMMTTLGKAGFQQSYTYFTWKNTKSELYELMAQLLDWSRFLRPNFFANTPDILHEYLQRGGRPAFEARLVLAATLSPSYGIYSGFESCENVAAAAGSEEYLDSEKYEVKRRALDGELLPLVQKLNTIRREHAALQRLENLRWLETENEQLVAYAKDDVLVVVNLDPRGAQEGVTVIPAALGLPPAFTVRDLLAGDDHAWRIGRNYVRLDPGQAHVLHVRR
ncbi:MAG TPA: alpha-1,4-glucan--maltose-1-phosphate maltosyltransferase [Gaiellaceae bacterium]|nr:alpha-1,4-glucan--maltose-1-phosphate maltosyltransferase [Gaiellaceae bacterium]